MLTVKRSRACRVPARCRCCDCVLRRCSPVLAMVWHIMVDGTCRSVRDHYCDLVLDAGLASGWHEIEISPAPVAAFDSPTYSGSATNFRQRLEPVEQRDGDRRKRRAAGARGTTTQYQALGARPGADPHRHQPTAFGCFLLSDIIMFAALFAAYAVLLEAQRRRPNWTRSCSTASHVLIETMLPAGCRASPAACFSLAVERRNTRSQPMPLAAATFAARRRFRLCSSCPRVDVDLIAVQRRSAAQRFSLGLLRAGRLARSST